ncbi:MAG: preprotein translocase subunit SecA, partial [Gemmatimonadota bacterium]
MLSNLKRAVTHVFGTRFEREMKKLQPIVDQIIAHESRLAGLSPEALEAQTEKFRGLIHDRTAALEAEIEALREKRRHTEEPSRRQELTERIAEAEDRLQDELRAILDELLPEAFATVREACRRLVGTRIT